MVMRQDMGTAIPTPRLTLRKVSETMPKATDIPNTTTMSASQPATVAGLTCTSRRGLLSGVGLAALAGAALAIATPSAASAHPNAELLAALAEFDALERQIFPDPPPATIEEEVWEVWAEPLMARRRACLDRLCEMETHTLEGFRARARSLLAWDDRHMPELEKQAAQGFWSYRMQLALLGDLAGGRSA